MRRRKTYGDRIDLALDLWIKLARAYNTFQRLSAKDIASLGVTSPQFSVIECLGHLGSLPIGELSKKMLVSGGNMTVVIDNLEKLGYVERVHSREDRRTVLVQLTKKGTQWFEESFEQHAHRIFDVASVLTAQEQRELARLLKKLGLSLRDYLETDSKS